MAAVELGALRYMTKPADPEELLQAMGEAVKLHRIARLKQQALALLGAEEKRISDRAGLEATFAKGLARLWMAYQPIVRWSTREIFAYEALLRTDEPAIPHPGIFLDIAERLGRVHDIGRAVRRAVARDLRQAPQGVNLFVNLHPDDLADPELTSGSAPLLEASARVVLEITERASLDGIVDLKERVARLKAQGYRTAIDDLGAGYAGLTSLAHLQPEVVKIDMSLVHGIDEDPRKRTLVRSLIEACSELGMMVVVEGIETAAQRDVVVEAGADLLQGFLFARPGRPFTSVSWGDAGAGGDAGATQ